MKVMHTLLVALVLAIASLSAYAGTHAKMEHVVLQVDDNDQAKWNLALNNAQNLQHAYKGNVKVEIVTYGPGVNMLKMESVVGNRVADAKKSGVAIVACQNTMRKMKLTNADMLPNTSYVPAGIVEVIKKERAGYAYIKP
jgi:intracellular sulfur oxidation DsrE/DsrF family protein